MISIDDFKKLEIKVGEIMSAERVENTDKLLKLSVDFAEERPRQIISGIAEYFPNPLVLVGKKCPFLTNLEHRTIKGLISEGMILAVSNEEQFSLLEASPSIKKGTTVR